MVCTACHAGQQAADKETAHTDMIAKPSENPENCSLCHAEIAGDYPESLHASQQGYWTSLEARGASHEDPAMQEMFSNHCVGCHTSCGDCHVSQPTSVGGGFIDGHNFNASPSMTRNCTACHGSRVGNEFLGKNEDVLADVHFRQGRMKCTDCHTGVELHGVGMDDSIQHRYDGEEMPRCENCHEEVGKVGDEIQMHTIHGDKLSCQVCHSVTYTSCDGCHVEVSDTTGNPFFSTEATYPTFYIGRNPRQDEYRPYEYVTLRHVPVAPTSFEFYGDNLLPTFDALPTWLYATPHNIQRQTPQNESCEACHGNAKIFLTADKVAESELTANMPVIVDQVPALGGGGGEGEDGAAASPFPPQPANHYGLTVCLACHTIISEPVLPPTHAEFEDSGCSTCHQVPEVPVATEEPQAP
jgi:thiosulfate/3-mercaptopyruvate sulfurtransferase